ncbi:flavin reductase [candidate division WOR-1 bacterium RIFOXYD2_FULL_36_8]|uniref:Flavin reductase n=1 Tax=candidate division WOR-1 bacterium RIFOXYB2_FULL_36_35 TaxID=1802578 RepID=A0A1F4S5W1_UNCSA|nr:MAG: flavin reductase [candidate division WOR-1 bacterium RIFOXYA2_FULL_36_21]OGC15757.1 MAG: flavin reductase [candidate division WOR-1 bacterium RIFOXYB2_FULL_36_35]OGC21112.1 MAG: flavin reductase [candidate division WOR-1 bacterium RIFOXYA12_FULL_36_13]OGC39390.1 MAG: flavin reductase [candidate division WOR-1 bacterium RIFOXYD2_FULL_36_8]
MQEDKDKVVWKPGTMVYPVPAVLVSCGDRPDNYNIITIAWTGTICSEPPMTYVSIRPHRHSHGIIKKTGEFVINLTTKELVYVTDLCGVKSGRDINKFKEFHLTPVKGEHVKAPLIKESPVNIECKVTEVKKLGTHDMFIAKVMCIHADKKYIRRDGKFDLRKADPIAYSHGNYYALGKYLGFYGYSVTKKKRR